MRFPLNFFRNSAPVIPLIRLNGAIGASSGLRSGGLSLAGVNRLWPRHSP
jgi:hypothetical protein